MVGIREIEAEALLHPQLDFFFSNGRLCVCRSPIGETIAQTDKLIARMNEVSRLLYHGKVTDFSAQMNGLEMV